jgi:hypothetical protein
MTKQQQKLLFFGLVIVVGSFFVGPIVNLFVELMNIRPPAPRFQQPKAPPKKVVMEMAPVTAPAITTAPVVTSQSEAPPPVPPELQGLSGIWRGRGAFEGRGLCDLKLELHEQDRPGHYTAFSSLTCSGAGPLVKNANAATATINQIDPEAAILSGGVEGNSIKFKIDKVTGVDANHCVFSSFALTPFGDRQLASEWTEDICMGGQMILKKAVR